MRHGGFEEAIASSVIADGITHWLPGRKSGGQRITGRVRMPCLAKDITSVQGLGHPLHLPQFPEAALRVPARRDRDHAVRKIFFAHALDATCPAMCRHECPTA